MSILDLARRAGDIPAGEVAPGVLIFGPTGNGKTRTACEGGRPFVLLMERNGLTTIKACNDDAQVFLVGVGKDGLPIDTDPLFQIRGTLEQVRGVVRAAKNGELKAAGFDRLVIDSLTELQRLFRDGIVAEKANDKKEADQATERRVPTSDEDEDGMSLRDWGTLQDRMQAFLRTIRSLPLPVVCTALVEDLGTKAPSSIRPLFMGKKFASQVGQFFSAVGFAARRNVEVTAPAEGADPALKSKTEYRTMFDGPSTYAIKSCAGASGVIEPNVLGWIKAVSETGPAPAPAGKTKDVAPKQAAQT